MCDVVNETLYDQAEQVVKDSLEVPDVLLIVVSTIGVILNGLFLVLGRNHLPKSCAILICNLAVADLATLFISILLGLRRKIPSPRFSSIASSLSLVTVSVSFSTLLAIAVQRYLAVVHSLWYFSKSRNRPRLLKGVSISTWLLSAILGVIHEYTFMVTSLIVTIIFELIIAIVVFLYVRIYMFVRNRRVCDRQEIITNQRNCRQPRAEKEAELSVVVFCVTALLIVGALPYIIILQTYVTLFLFADRQALLCNRTLSAHRHYWFVVEMLPFSLNPIIYVWRLQIKHFLPTITQEEKTETESIEQQQRVSGEQVV